MQPARHYRNFAEFYPFYLSEHANRSSRRLHFIGSSLALILLLAALLSQIWWLAPLGIVQGYAFAWVGHFCFEHNRPATFQYPRLSLMGDCRLWWEIASGQRPF